MELDTRAYFTIVTMSIAIPTGSKIYNYMMTINNSSHAYNLSNPSPFIIMFSFVVLFTIGGVTGVVLGNAMVDIVLHDTYYVIAHFHFVLSLGTSLSIVIGTLLMFEFYFGTWSYVNNFTAPIVSTVIIIAMSGTFLAMHFLGFNTMPRRYIDYMDNLSYWNYVCTFSITLFMIAIPSIYIIAAIVSSIGATGNSLAMPSLPSFKSYAANVVVAMGNTGTSNAAIAAII
jgi:heme/copper-type cytochrome/quinol oxidase subunit 1